MIQVKIEHASLDSSIWSRGCRKSFYQVIFCLLILTLRRFRSWLHCLFKSGIIWFWKTREIVYPHWILLRHCIYNLKIWEDLLRLSEMTLKLIEDLWLSQMNWTKSLPRLHIVRTFINLGTSRICSNITVEDLRFDLLRMSPGYGLGPWWLVPIWD